MEKWLADRLNFLAATTVQIHPSLIYILYFLFDLKKVPRRAYIVVKFLPPENRFE